MSGPRPAPDPAEIARRIWAKDASLWSDDPKVQAAIRNRLGWLDLPERMRAEIPSIRAFADEIRAEGFTQALVLGMGGSSLCVEVLAKAIGTQPGWLEVRICDTTVPADILEATAWAERAKTLFVVSSKSGTTIETTSLYRHFRARIPDGARFVAITDPGSALEALARAERFRKVFAHPVDVGGRYAALSPVGLVPAALMGLDPGGLLPDAPRREPIAASLEHSSNPWRPRPTPEGSMAATLATSLAAKGRPLLAFDQAGAPRFAPIATWIEQLVAESTGKAGAGFLPLPCGRDAVPQAASRTGRPPPWEWILTLKDATSPDPARLGKAFLYWESVSAALGAVLGVNPFDEPDVRSAKERTGTLLEGHLGHGRLPEPSAPATASGLRAWHDPGLASGASSHLQDLLRAHLARLRETDVAALLAFVPRRAEVASAVDTLRTAIRDGRRATATLQWGPRYLHSTGQFWKGGPDIGVFLMLTADDPEDVPIPGAPYSFGTLCRAQALGDYEALVERGRRVMRVHLGRDIAGGLRALTSMVG